MNKVYRLIWNEVHNCWTVACEFARGKGKGKNGARRARRDLIGATALSLSLLADPAAAFIAAGTTGEPGDDDNTIASATSINGGRATDDGTIAIGTTAAATSANAIAIGTDAWVDISAADSLTIGTGANVRGGSPNAVALGSGAAVGYGDEGATAIGFGATVNDYSANAIALGSRASASGNASITIGADSSASQDNAVAVGNNAQARGLSTIAVGQNANADADNSIALGLGATASSSGGVALGAGSVANTPAGIDGYMPMSIGWSWEIDQTRSTLGAVSVGDAANGQFRQITGVAAGTENSDAVNVAQLKAVDEGIFKLRQDALLWDQGADGGAGAYSANHWWGPSKITNVAAGELSAPSSDAVNGSQLYATNLQVTQNTTDIADNSTAITNLSTNINYGTVGPVQRTGTDQLSLIASGGEAYAPGNAQVLTNVAAGAIYANSVDAVNGSQLHALASSTANALGGGSTVNADGSISAPSYLLTNIEGSTNVFNNVGDALSSLDARVVQNTTDIANGTVGPVQRTGTDQLSLIAAGGDALNPGNAQVLNNVAAGAVLATSTDAVNGSQLYETNQQVTTNATNITNLDGRVTTVEGSVTTIQGDVANIDSRVTTVEGSVTNLGNQIDTVYATGTKYFHANSTGADSSATGADSVAIGMGAVASHDGSVALGAGSVADGSTLSQQAYLVGGTATGEVNVGGRRVTGVSAGAADTDAVNVAQLKQVAAGSVADAVMYDDGSHTAITLGGTAGTTISNVAAGVVDATSTDAVNGSQLYTTNQQVTANTTNITNLDGRVTNVEGSVTTVDNRVTSIQGDLNTLADTPISFAGNSGTVSKKLGETLVIEGAATTAGSYSGANVKTEVDSNGVLQVKIADNAVFESVTTGNATLGSDGLTIAGGPSVTISGIDGGGKTIRNVADGVNATDAVNMSQLSQVAAAATANAVTYDDASHTTITLGGTMYDSSTHSGGTKITNVADGVADSDAVNVAQLNQTNQVVSNLSNTVNNIYGGGIKYFHANSVGSDSLATGADAVAIGMGAVADKDHSVALGAGSTTGRGANAGYTDGTGLLQNQNSVGEVSVGSTGAERQITHVASGSAGTDAVNVDQLNAALKNLNPSNGTPPNANQSDSASSMFKVSDDYNTLAPQATGNKSVAGGSNAIAVGNNSAAIGNNAQATGNASTAIGNGAISRGSNSVALGNGSDDGGRSNVVSVGSAGAERKITNVHAGELSNTSTDAVNGSQLKATNDQVATLGNAVNSIHEQVMDLDHSLSAGVAAAMATAGLPQTYRPGASMVGVGAATWNGESAVSLGISTITDNGRWVIKAAGNATSRGTYGASVGAGFQF